MEPKLFSSRYNDYAEEFKAYLPVNINLRYETIASHLTLCEETFVRPLLGAELFDRMANYYRTNPTLPTDTPDKQLIEKVRFALIRLAIWKGYDIISTNISDVGVSAEVDKENRLYRYQEENIKKTLKEEGFNYLDNVLEYLEENSGEFPEFASSGYVLDSTSTLIRNTRMFNSCYDIGSSRLVFLKMKQYIRDVEQIELQHRVGVKFFHDLLTADETAAEWCYLLPCIRQYVVYMAVASGIGELHKMPTEKGLLFETSSMDGVQLAPVVPSQLMETRATLCQKATQYLASAIHLIKQSPETYPNFIGFAGECPDDGVMRFDNTHSKIFIA